MTHQPENITDNSSGDPILYDLRAGLRSAYGERLARLVLFGSRARGDATADSDYDVAVFLRDMTDRWAEFDRVNGVAGEILLRRFAVVHALPYHERSYAENPSSLMRNIREEGVEL
jgi:predicted nucleotidyltransferase